jgi:hypothetical protein
VGVARCWGRRVKPARTSLVQAGRLSVLAGVVDPAAHREAHQADQPDDQKRQAAGLRRQRRRRREDRDAARIRLARRAGVHPVGASGAIMVMDQYYRGVKFVN